MKNLILTTDTLHHKFFLKNIIDLTETIIIYETKKVKFNYKTFHKYKHQENKFEKKFFFENKIPKFKVKKFKDLNDKKAIQYIKELDFDNIFCFGIGKLKLNFLSSFKDNKILNFHGGNPVFYRGLDSLLWAIYKNDFKGQLSDSLTSSLYDEESKNNIFDSWQFEVRHEGKLVAFSVFDKGEQSIESIKGIYDPEFSSYSLGIYTMLLEIRSAIQDHKNYYYPGYFAPGCSSFD